MILIKKKSNNNTEIIIMLYILGHIFSYILNKYYTHIIIMKTILHFFRSLLIV